MLLSFLLFLFLLLLCYNSDDFFVAIAVVSDGFRVQCSYRGVNSSDDGRSGNNNDNSISWVSIIGDLDLFF